MRVHFRGLTLGAFAVLATAVPAASAAGAQPLPAKAYKASVSVEKRQFCATRSVDRTGRGPAHDRRPGRRRARGARPTGPPPRTGTSGSSTRRPARRSSGSAQTARRRVRDRARAQGPAARAAGCAGRTAPPRCRSRYGFTKLAKAHDLRLQDQAGPGLDPDGGVQGAPRRARARHDRPSRPRRTGTCCCYSAAQERKLKAAGLEFSVRIADVKARDRANRLKERRNGAPPRPREGARGDRRAAARPTARCPRSRRTCRRSRLQNPGSSGCSRCPRRSWEGREIMGVEIAENVERPGGRPPDVHPGRHAPRP